MATYKEIQKYVKQRYGFVAQTCWIAHVKELNGLDVRRSPNRQSSRRVKPCPLDKQEPIREALKHFGMLEATP
ncbi:putative RNA methyltransferase [Anaerolineae bacterium]|nr:putative RNA methyltransferase [Anaerolineae bacterium]